MRVRTIAAAPLPTTAITLPPLYRNRIVTNNGTLQQLLYNGSIVTTPMTAAATVSSFIFGTLAAGPLPDPTLAVQQDSAARLLSVRFVRINAAPGNCLCVSGLQADAVLCGRSRGVWPRQPSPPLDDAPPPWVASLRALAVWRASSAGGC